MVHPPAEGALLQTSTTIGGHGERPGTGLNMLERFTCYLNPSNQPKSADCLCLQKRGCFVVVPCALLGDQQLA